MVLRESSKLRADTVLNLLKEEIIPYYQEKENRIDSLYNHIELQESRKLNMERANEIDLETIKPRVLFHDDFICILSKKGNKLFNGRLYHEVILEGNRGSCTCESYNQKSKCHHYFMVLRAKEELQVETTITKKRKLDLLTNFNSKPQLPQSHIDGIHVFDKSIQVQSTEELNSSYEEEEEEDTDTVVLSEPIIDFDTGDINNPSSDSNKTTPSSSLVTIDDIKSIAEGFIEDFEHAINIVLQNSNDEEMLMFLNAVKQFRSEMQKNQ